MTGIYETGAKTSLINNLILLADNTQEIAKLRDTIYMQCVKDKRSVSDEFIKLYTRTVQLFIANDLDSESIMKDETPDTKIEFCKLYADEFENWCQENDIDLENTLAYDLKCCTVEGYIVKLPPIDQQLLDYKSMRVALLNAGGVYKKNTFVFTSDAQSFIDRLCTGQNVNIKKQYQFYATQPEQASRLVELSGIEYMEEKILEPSAGQGALIEAMNEQHPFNSFDVGYCELMPENTQVLKGKKLGKYLGENFLELGEEHHNQYHRVIANPPFSRGQDIEHIRKMYDCCKAKGSVACIMSTGWTFNGSSKQKAFRAWLGWSEGVTDFVRINEQGKAENVHFETIDSDAFKKSGASASSCIVVIHKQ